MTIKIAYYKSFWSFILLLFITIYVDKIKHSNLNKTYDTLIYLDKLNYSN